MVVYSRLILVNRSLKEKLKTQTSSVIEGDVRGCHRAVGDVEAVTRSGRTTLCSKRFASYPQKTPTSGLDKMASTAAVRRSIEFKFDVRGPGRVPELIDVSDIRFSKSLMMML